MEGSPVSSEDSAWSGHYWAEYPKAYEDVVARSTAVSIEDYLSPEDAKRLSEQAAELGLPDPGKFLRAEIVRFNDIRELHEEISESQLGEFIDTVLTAARDSSYA